MLEPSGRCRDDFGGSLRAVAFFDRTEVIKGDQIQRDMGFAALGTFCGLQETVRKKANIGQLRQAIVVRLRIGCDRLVPQAVIFRLQLG